ncbi:hypothetical protein D3C80_1987500 [compost metagenome]
MEDTFARVTGGLELTEWPVHGIQQAQAFRGAVVQVLRVTLEWQITLDVHVPQVHRGVTFGDPLG